MELILFIGLQASGKSEFYKQNFYKTHIRLNLDMLKTRNREKMLMEACILAKQPLVIDNTNPTVKDRKRYIQSAKEKGFKVIGYYFQTHVDEAVKRNEQRTGKEKIPAAAIYGTFKILELPQYEEGFDELKTVHISDNFNFTVEDYKY